MKLEMRNKSQLAQTLPDHEQQIETGAMGACVCAIVMWDYDTQSRRYEEVRGFHGYGGIQAVNWESLFEEVPDTAATKVWIICGPGNLPNDPSLLVEIGEARRLGASQAQFAIYHGVKGATLDRSGRWIECVGQRTRMSHQFAVPFPMPRPQPGISGKAKTVDDGSRRQPAPKLFAKYDLWDPLD